MTFTETDRAYWRLFRSDIVINEVAAIEQSWLRAEHGEGGFCFGAPMEQEHQVMRGGVTTIEQQFTAARAVYNMATGKVDWYTPAGTVTV